MMASVWASSKCLNVDIVSDEIESRRSEGSGYRKLLFFFFLPSLALRSEEVVERVWMNEKEE